MLEFCLLVLPWTVEPGTIERSMRNVRPISTCGRPAVKVIEPHAAHSSSPLRSTDAREIATWLRLWERATRDAPAQGRSGREEFRRTIHQEFNEHTAVAAEHLVGHVRANWLNDVYDWTIVERMGHGVCLEAIPRDETERLFYGSFRISLTAQSGFPERIVVVGRNEIQRTVWQSETPSNVDGIRLVHFEDNVPPAPRLLLRTADARH